MSLASPHALLADFSDHYRGLLRFLTRRTGCGETAKDLAHDTWLRLAERGHAELAPQSDHRAYLYTVAANLAGNLHRHQNRGAERFIADSGEILQHEPHIDDTDNIPRRLALQQAIAAIEAALHALPARCRGIFLAHRLEGVGQEALALQHGISVKTVERDILLAMDSVHAALLRWRGDPPVRTARHGRRQALAALLGVAGVGTATHWVWRQWQAGVATFTLALQTPNARQLRQALPDGSTLTLDAASRAEVAFYPGRRSVRLLAGSAFFAVARDTERPFVVETALARITVLGTRFAVELEDGAVQVAVESGRVQVQPVDGAALELRAGGQARIGAQGAGVQRGQPNVSLDVAPWREGWLDFRGTPLADAVQRLARYYPHPIRVAPGAAQLPVLGRLRIASTGEWLQLLPRSMPVRVQLLADGAVEITPRI